MRFSAHLTSTALAILFSAASVSAQTKELKPDARVRILSIHDKVVIGQVLNPGPDSISLLESRSGIQRSVARADIARIQMKVKGDRGVSTMKGGLFGLIGGAVAGGFLGALAYSPSSDAICIMACSAGESAAMGATVLGVGGLVLGMVIGSGSGGDQGVDVPIRSR